MKCIICLNGDKPDKTLLKEYAGDSYIIAADGACGYLDQYGVKADLIVGDFDSYSYELTHKMLKSNGEIIKHNVEKDYTDGQLALTEALKRGFKDIVLLGALGGRLDHTLENIRLLYTDDDSVKIIAKCTACEVFILKGYAEIKADAPRTISILPYTDCIEIGKTVGFKYCAEDLILTKLKNDSHSGLSNVLLSQRGEIFVNHGAALVIVYNTVY